MRLITIGKKEFYLVHESEQQEGDLSCFFLGLGHAFFLRNVQSGYISKGDLCACLDLGTYDTALPQDYVDREEERSMRLWKQHFNTGEWVWHYPPGSLFGEPLNLLQAIKDRHGDEILKQLAQETSGLHW